MENQQKKRKHLTEEQKDIMISFMESNGDICSSGFSSVKGREKKRKLMQELSNLLNSVENGVVRTPKEWIKSWTDNKNKTKSKASALARHRLGTGGGPPLETPPLTPWEERILGLMSNELVLGHNVPEAEISEIISTGVSVGETTPIISERVVLEAGPSTAREISDFEMTDHEYAARRSPTSRESTPTHSETDFEPRRKRVRRLSKQKDEDFVTLMKEFISAQKETAAAVANLGTSFKEGCKTIAEALKVLANK